MIRIKKPPFLLILAFVAFMSCLVFYACYRLDNKYTRPRPSAKMGVTQVDMDWFEGHPLFYLVDQWAFYADQLLSPDEIGDYAPDDYFYIGRHLPHGGAYRWHAPRLGAGGPGHLHPLAAVGER